MEGERPAKKEALAKWLAGLLFASAIAALLWFFFAIKVCDEQLTESGSAVQVCRHLQVTDPPVVAIGLVAIASLGAFFTEISGFGVSLKREVRDAKEAAALAKITADSAAGAAESAEQAAQVGQELSLGLLQTASETPAAAPPQEIDLAQGIQALADEYVATRKSLPPGSERTAQMTSIVSRMIASLSGVSPDQIDISEYLRSDHRGKRLAGYACLYANPDPRRTQELVDVLSREDKPFGEYWALRALRRQLQADPRALDANTRRRLEELGHRYGPTTDRAHELRQALAEAGS